MSNYKSKHSGAQVDEAVSKVLSGGSDWNAKDPVVWKYMCNPYIISAHGTPDNDLPEELRNIIEDENGYLTTLALKVLAMNYDGITYSINYVSETSIKSEFGLLIYEHGRFYPEP
jgi:hypothetical protein